MEIAIFQIVVFVAYVAFIRIKLGALPSISDSYFHLGKLNWLFTLFCFLISFPMFFHSKEFHPDIATEPDYTFLFFLSMLLSFTGVAANFKESTARIIHFAGVMVSAPSALLALGLQYNIWYPLIGTLLTTVFIVINAKRIIWFTEIAAFYWILTGITNLYIHTPWNTL